MQDFEIEHDFPGIGRRVLVLNARQLDGLEQILLGIEDVTERRERGPCTARKRRALRRMADAAPAMIWVSGADKTLYLVNKRWLDFTGRTMEQELGHGWAERVHPDDLKRCLEIYSSSFDARRSFQMEYRLRRADGEYRWLLDNGVPRFEPRRRLCGLHRFLRRYHGSQNARRKQILPSRNWRPWERWPVALPTISITFWREYWLTRNWRWRSLPVVRALRRSCRESAMRRFAAPKSCGS